MGQTRTFGLFKNQRGAVVKKRKWAFADDNYFLLHEVVTLLEEKMGFITVEGIFGETDHYVWTVQRK